MMLCLDVGGTYMRPALATASGQLTALPTIKTPQDGYEPFLACIGRLAESLGEQVTGLALSITGVHNRSSGLFTCANIPALSGRALLDDLTQRAGMTVTLMNDADCFALAESVLGAGKGHRTVFAIILGSGVGGALVADGRVIEGAVGYAGEWGHGTILAEHVGTPPRALPHRPCGCGRHGCVNTVGGARGLEALHVDLAGTALSSHEILAGWQAHDADCTTTIAAYVELVSRPLAYVLNITGASIVVCGGGLASSPALLAALGEATQKAMLFPPPHGLLVAASLGDDSGLMGAALAGQAKP